MAINLNNTRTLLAVVLASFSSLIIAQDEQSSTYSLEQCIEYALQNHENIKNAQLDISISDQKVIETRAIGLPQLSGKVEYTNTIQPMSQFLPANAFAPQAPEDSIIGLGFGVNHSMNASLTLSQLIFDGSYLVGLQTARTYKELSQHMLKQSKIDVVEQVTKAYYGATVVDERIRLLELNLSRIEAASRDTKVMVDNGFAEKLDYQRLTVSKNNIKTELQKLKSLNEISMQALKFQMGLPLDQPIELSQNLEDFVSEFEISTGDPSVENRNEYQTLKVQQVLNGQEVKYEKVMRYPNLVGFVNGGANIGALDFGDLFQFGDYREYAMFGVTLNVPIFSSGQSNARIRQAKYKLDKSENDLSMLKRSIEFETYQARSTYNNNLATLQFQQENIDLAEEVFDSAKKKYDAGVGSNLELIEAETALKESQINYLSAVYDVLTAQTDLKKAYGNLYNGN